MKTPAARMFASMLLVSAISVWGAAAQADQVCCEKPLSSRATDGCSNPLKDEITKRGKKVFRSACDFHDMCYAHLGKKKSHCDSKFRDKMQSACKKLSYKDGFKYVCGEAVSFWWAAVALKGGDAYKGGQEWAKDKCYVSKTKSCKNGYRKATYDMN